MEKKEWISDLKMFIKLIKFCTLSIKIFHDVFPMKASLIDQLSYVHIQHFVMHLSYPSQNLGEGQRKLPLQEFRIVI